MQIGIRHILPVLALFVILSGAAFSKWYQFGWQYKGVLCGCALWASVSVASYYPQMIPYFNELVSDRKTAYKFLADSNLDWNQDEWVVDDYLKRNPDVLLNPPAPVKGRILVRGNLLAGVSPEKLTTGSGKGSLNQSDRWATHTFCLISHNRSFHTDIATVRCKHFEFLFRVATPDSVN